MTPPDTATRRIIASWLAQLAKVTRHKQGRLSDDEVAALKDERAIYAELLAMDLPSGAFTLDSLHAVAQGHSFFPAYDEIRRTVQAWWNENKPAIAPRIEDDSPAGRLGAADRSWFDYYHRRLREGGNARLLGSMVRRYSPAAWDALRAVQPHLAEADAP